MAELIQGARVTLGPMSAEAIEPLRAEIRRISGVEPPPGVLEDRLDASGSWDDHQVLLGIAHAGVTIGTAQASACPRTAPPGVYEVGLTLFDEQHRGKGIGSEALQLLTSYLFRDRNAVRVWLATDVDNIAMRRTAEKLGFLQEGILRDYGARDGEPINAVLYAITRADIDSA